MNKYFYSLILFIGVFISSISQVMLKKSANKDYDNHLKEYLNPIVIFAYLLFFISTLMSIYAYKGIPLSMGPLIEATSYFYITYFGIKIFKEKLNNKMIIALLFIIVGIIIYSLLG